MDALLTDIGTLDWNDLTAVTHESDKLLTALNRDRELLRGLVDGALAAATSPPGP
jgi:hypothetical protein